MARPRGKLNARITLPRASRPVLMWTESLRRMPVFPVRAARSDPARSTTWSLEQQRLERSFICVGPVCRRALPACRTLSNSSAEVVTASLPSTSDATRGLTQDS
uniref:Uncharacterized protein n=1 Tax=Esox lucius TaxID=8010 RepID=A0A6Q2YAU1_ESOLU